MKEPKFIEINNKYLIPKLGIGVSNAKKARELYVEYKADFKAMECDREYFKSYDYFYRIMRKEVKAARRKGIKICGDNNGFYIASNDEEFDKWVESTIKRARNLLLTAANSKKMSLTGFIRKAFFSTKKEKNDGQLSFIENLQE